MKKLLLIFSFAMAVTAVKAQNNMYVEPKLNVPAAAIAIINPAVEIGFCNHSALELSLIGAFAKNNYLGTGYPFLFNMTLLEYRNYFLNKEHKGLFAGVNLGWNMFKTNKNMIPIIDHGKDPDSYDWGFGTPIGATVGYKFLFKERFGLEISVSGGWQHTWHEPYLKGSMQKEMNASGEWLIYKGGIYFSYRFGQKK